MAYTLTGSETAFPAEAGGIAGRLTTWAGALVSVLLLAGLCSWGWQLFMRDVAGVPVVRAIVGPMRVAPAEPGGEVAEYQSLTVTRVASEGAEQSLVERVVLAPPAVELAAEDRAVAALIPDTPSAEPVLPATVAPPQSAIELAIAEALAGTAGPAPAEAPESVAEPVAESVAASVAESVAASVAAPRPARMIRPAIRPAFQSVQAGVQLIRAAAPAAPVAPDAIAPGTRMVQLGAFPSPEDAAAAWDQLAGPLGAFLGGKTRVVEAADAGGATFYRLRATGFDDLADARRFCAVVVSQHGNCIPVLHR